MHKEKNHFNLNTQAVRDAGHPGQHPRPPVRNGDRRDAGAFLLPWSRGHGRGVAALLCECVCARACARVCVPIRSLGAGARAGEGEAKVHVPFPQRRLLRRSRRRPEGRRRPGSGESANRVGSRAGCRIRRCDSESGPEAPGRSGGTGRSGPRRGVAPAHAAVTHLAPLEVVALLLREQSGFVGLGGGRRREFAVGRSRRCGLNCRRALQLRQGVGQRVAQSGAAAARGGNGALVNGQRAVQDSAELDLGVAPLPQILSPLKMRAIVKYPLENLLASAMRTWLSSSRSATVAAPDSLRAAGHCNSRSLRYRSS